MGFIGFAGFHVILHFIQGYIRLDKIVNRSFVGFRVSGLRGLTAVFYSCFLEREAAGVKFLRG